jgi:hypothetical protein
VGPDYPGGGDHRNLRGVGVAAETRVFGGIFRQCAVVDTNGSKTGRGQTKETTVVTVRTGVTVVVEGFGCVVDGIGNRGPTRYRGVVAGVATGVGTTPGTAGRLAD